MNVFQKFTKKWPLLFGLLSAALFYILMCYMPFPTNFGNWTTALRELALALIAIIIILIFVKPSPFHFTLKGGKYAIKKSLYYLIILFLIMGFMSLAMILSAVIDSTNGMSTMEFGQVISGILSGVVLAISVGFYEEIFFRLSLFGGLISKMGSSTKGIIGAAIISSLVFGFVHTVSSLFTSDAYTLVGGGQILGKTITSGVFGFLCCAIYLKTKNFLLLALLHALNDLIPLMLFSAVGGSSPTYVDGNSLLSLASYGVYIILYIPVIVSSIKMLKSVKTPEYGPLASDNFLPCIPEDNKTKEKHNKQAKEN